jgi:hypothetical protein
LRTRVALAAAAGILAALPSGQASADPPTACPKPFTLGVQEVIGLSPGDRDKNDNGVICVKTHHDGDSRVNMVDDRGGI